MAAAAAIPERLAEITYSRKVFVPLTNMCRDGEWLSCKGVLFSLGEKLERR